MDKRGVTEAIRSREKLQAACHHEPYISPPKYPGGPTVKECRKCGQQTFIKGG
jgi:hypothetical protein